MVYRERLILNLGLHALLSTGAVLMLLPLAWMVSTSLKPVQEVFSYPLRWIPTQPAWENYVEVFRAVPLARYLWNSVIVSSTVVLTNLLFCSLAGYSLARFRYPGRDVLFVLLISTMLIPVQMIFVPLFLVVRAMGLTDTYAALVLPLAIEALGVFFMRQSILAIPQELIDSARIDGASEFRIFWTIVMPLVRSALAALGIFVFVRSWNAFLWPLIAVQSRSLFTLPVGLSAFQDVYGTEFHLLMAGTSIAVVPILVVFLLLQRHFIAGLTFSGLKG